MNKRLNSWAQYCHKCNLKEELPVEELAVRIVEYLAEDAVTYEIQGESLSYGSRYLRAIINNFISQKEKYIPVSLLSC